MNVLFTGASSKLGSRVLRVLVDTPRVASVWSGGRGKSVPPHAKVHGFALDLSAPPDLTPVPEPIDLTVHFAGVTHASAPEAYETVNRLGTERLAEAVFARGCRRFVYVSTRCLGPGSGPYGDSKRLAEESLRRLPWEGLLLLRPSEVYGAGGREGVDGLISLAERAHLVPLLFGHPGVRFSPLHCDDFVRTCAAAVMEFRNGVTVLEMCGPEPLSGTELALRIARRYKALPVPVWLPAAALLGRAAAAVGARLFAPDQLARLTGPKTAELPAGGPVPASRLTRFLVP